MLVLTLLATALAVTAYGMLGHWLEQDVLAHGSNVLVRPYGWQDGVAVLLITALLTSAIWGQSAPREHSVAVGENTSAMEQAMTICIGSGFMLLMGLMLLAYIRVIREMDPGEMFGLRVMPLRQVAQVAGVVVLPAFLFVTALSYISQEMLAGVWHDLTPQSPVKILQQSQNAFVQALLAVSAVVIAPLAEELLFRGYIYGVLKRFTDGWFAALCSAMVFAIVHLHVGTLLPLFALGIILVVAYEMSGSLLVPVFIHGLFNAATTALILAGYGG
jgi:membrane protease YdiL (CAAX protease family)